MTIDTEPVTGRWHSWHLHLDSLRPEWIDAALQQVVAPTIATIAQRDRDAGRTTPRPWFFIRYWQGGPHVRLRIAGLADSAADSVADDLETALAIVNDSIPATARTTAAAYEVAAAPLARLGEGSGAIPLAPPAPPGVAAAVYEPEYARYGGIDAMPMTEALFHASSVVALRVCQARNGAGRRRADGIEALAATLSAWPGDRMALLAGVRDGWAAWLAEPGNAAAVRAQADLIRAAAAGLRGLVDGTPSQWSPWTKRLGAATRLWQERFGTDRVAQIFGSHLHMTQNRLGTGGQESHLAAVLHRTLVDTAPAPTEPPTTYVSTGTTGL